jgi:hypothetical protein
VRQDRNAPLQVAGKQVNALLRKSWAYQRKNICMNIFILLAPIAIAILLGVLQALFDSLLSDQSQVQLPETCGAHGPPTNTQ